MANHISLTSIDGTMAIVDKSRIISCISQNVIDEEQFEKAMKQYDDDKKIWGDKKQKAFFSDTNNSGAWEVKNPGPVRPDRDDFAIDEKVTRISLNNKTSLLVQESPEVVFEKIKGIENDE